MRGSSEDRRKGFNLAQGPARDKAGSGSVYGTTPSVSYLSSAHAPIHQFINRLVCSLVCVSE